MSLPSLKISKLWLDDSFFEVKFNFYTEQCSVSIDIYTDNEELNELRSGIIEFSNFKQKEFVWIAGRDTEEVTHFLSLRFFLYDKRGYVGIEVTADNKRPSPESVRATFYIVTVLSEIDDFVRKLKSFTNEEIDEIESFSNNT